MMTEYCYSLTVKNRIMGKFLRRNKESQCPLRKKFEKRSGQKPIARVSKEIFGYAMITLLVCFFLEMSRQIFIIA